MGPGALPASIAQHERRSRRQALRSSGARASCPPRPSHRRGRPPPPRHCAPPRPACRRRSCGLVQHQHALDVAQQRGHGVLVQITVRVRSSRRRRINCAMLDLARSGRGHLVEQQQQGRVASAMPISSRRCWLGVIAAAGNAACAARPIRFRTLVRPSAARSRCAAAPELQTEIDVGRHAQLGEYARRLEGACDALLCEAVRPGAGEACAGGEQFARCRLDHARQRIEEGRLAPRRSGR